MTFDVTKSIVRVGPATLRGHGGSDLPLDGRTHRRVQTHQKILNAVFSLVGEGMLQPRSEQIAERADVAVRTIFRHFSDMDGLYGAARNRMEEALDAEPRNQSQLGGSLEQRAQAYAEQQGCIFDSARNYVLFYLSRARTAEEAKGLQRRNVAEQRLRLWTALPECAAASIATRRTVEHLYSFQCWDQMRFGQGASIEDTVTSIATGAATLLTNDEKTS